MVCCVRLPSVGSWGYSNPLPIKSQHFVIECLLKCIENVKDGGKQGFMVQKNEPFSTGVWLNQIGAIYQKRNTIIYINLINVKKQKRTEKGCLNE